MEGKVGLMKRGTHDEQRNQHNKALVGAVGQGFSVEGGWAVGNEINT